ncbi:MAG: 4Fe-4S dicluster domain-containing protein [Chlorobi bacterium]|nr:4Fe-4S dicluster domain-containing protein [Chlorobiota bacterium]
MINERLEINNEYCSGCGICKSICPVDAISFKKNDIGLSYPVIDFNVCVNCMLCFKACDTKEDINNKRTPPIDHVNSKAYYAYSIDDELRYKAATAGVVSQISKTLLEVNDVDVVVAASQNDNNTIETKYIEKQNIDELPSGSIYRQVVLLDNYIEKVTSSNWGKVLVIGLPCHIAAVKSLHEITPKLKKVKLYTIALFCKQTKDDRFADFIRKYLKEKDKNAKVDFRGDGWPGVTRVNNKRVIFTDYKLSFMWGTFCYTPQYCMKCKDSLGVTADISVGDAWVKEYMSSDKKGSSFLLVNTDNGHELFNHIKNNIYFENKPVETVLKSQGVSVIKFKEKLADEFIHNGRIHNRLFFKAKKFVEFIYSNNFVLVIPKVALKILYRFLLSKIMFK